MAKSRRRQPEPSGVAPFAHLRGLGVALIVTTIFILLATILLSITSITESLARWLVVGGGAIAVLAGGFKVGKSMGNSGMLNGGVIGLAYVVVAIILALLLDVSVSARSFVSLVAGFALGAVGGIWGVNQR